jgi:ABC-2 type transport system permease protein
VAERASGTLLRLRAAPVRRASILGGKALACAVACVADVVLLSVLAWLVLGVRIGDPGKYAAVVAAMVVCFAGLTMVLTVLGRSEQAVAGAGWATLILMAMLGGAMVPLALFPERMLELSDLSPVKWGILALEGATWRAFGWDELAKPVGILVATGVVGFVSGVGVLVASREV